MARNPRYVALSRQIKLTPEIEWDGATWFVRLPVHDGNVLEAKWKPGRTYVFRIREADERIWSIGFESPLKCLSFEDLKPDTEYELQVRVKDSAGKGEPRLVCVRTGRTGHAGNVIPFPKR